MRLSDKQKALVAVIKRDDSEVFESLVGALKSKGDLCFRDTDGWGVIQICASFGCHDILSQVLSRQLPVIDINDDNEGKGTALHLAVSKGSFSLAKCLLDHGADPLIKNSHGLTALDLATTKKSNKLVDLLKKYQKVEIKHSQTQRVSLEKRRARSSSDWRVGTTVEREERLLSACARGDLEELAHLDKLNVSFLSSDLHNNRPLHLAARNGHLEVCRYLIEKGVCRQPLNESGLGPLHCACAFGSLELVKFFVEDVLLDTNLRSRAGRKPIFYAKNPAILSYLTEIESKIALIRQEDMSDSCIKCQKPLSFKFGDTLENVPSCHKTHRSPVFFPMDPKISLFDIRFGSLADSRCKECSQKGALCRCICELDQDNKIWKSHVPRVSSRIALCMALSRSISPQQNSSLNVLRNSPKFDPNNLRLIFEFLN